MPGLIEQIMTAGVESNSFALDNPATIVGGERINYKPKDLAAIITCLRGFTPKTYLPLEGITMGGAKFIADTIGCSIVSAPKPEFGNDSKMRQFLRRMEKPVDLISLDARGLALDVDAIWRYIEGGKEPVKEFGKGAPMDYGIPKLKPAGCVIINLSDPGSRDLWCRLRARYSQVYQSPLVGMIKT